MSILKNQKNKTYLAVSLLGKSLNLDVKYKANPLIEIDKEKENKIVLYLPKKYKSMENVHIVNMAIEKLYDEIAETEIENAMEKIRSILGFAPEDYKIERMKNSFCKVKDGIITINPDIVKFSKKIIEITILQGFCKSQYRTNSNAYKQLLEDAVKKYEEFKFDLIRNNKSRNSIKKVS